MSAPVPSTRRLAIAIGTAATSATVAIGVTAASLLGWFSPSPGPPGPDLGSETSAPAPAPSVTRAPSPVILVPVAPMSAPQPATDPVNDVQLVMDTDDDHERREHGRNHHDEEEGDDDD